MLYSYNMSTETNQDRVFKALSAGVRRAILDALKDAPRTTGALCEAFRPLDRCTVMQHLKVLEEADLIIVQRKGRERWNHLNPLPIKEVHDRWIGPHAARAVEVLGRLKRDLEVAPD
jgi:DNA-binding transcriptional ArsR family regulator